MSNLILYIGHTGMGKTFRVKKLLKASDKQVYCFDVNDEYREYNRVVNGDFKLFLNESAKKKNTNLIFEDATGYLTGKTAEELRKIIVAKRHTHNNILMLFHSISAVPPFIFQLANYIVLMKTADELSSVKNKKESLIIPFMKLRRMPMLKAEKEYSPSFQIKNI